MEKYKRFSEEIVDGEPIQEFLDKLTSDGWQIIYYNEREYGGMGMVKLTVIGKKVAQVL